MKKTSLIFIVLLSLGALGAARAERPVSAVIPLRSRVLDESEIAILADLFSYGLTGDGRFIVVGRQDAARIIKSLDMPPMDAASDGYHFYLGDRLYVNALFAGEIAEREGRLVWKMAAYDPDAKIKICEAEAEADDLDGLYEACPGLLKRLLALMPASFGRGLNEKYETALAPFKVRQRLLFIFPEGPLDSNTAVARERLAGLFTGALKTDEILPLFLERSWDIADEAALPIAELAARFDAHRVFTLTSRDGAAFIVLRDSAGAELSSFPATELASIDDAGAVRALATRLPPLSQGVIAREIEIINDTNAKLAGLMREKRIMDKRFAVSVGQKVAKTVGHPSFHPNLNFLSLEANFFWYYSGLLGIGGGYGLSLGYPGTIDSDIAGHPLFLQHELRFYPLALRMPGERGFKVDCFLSLNEHNASTITFPAAENTTFTDSRPILFSRIGAEVGYVFNLSERFALSLNALTIAYCVPIIEGNNFQTDRNFSLDIGGIGIIIRF